MSLPTEIIEVEGCPIVGYDISYDAIRRAQSAVIGSGTDDIIPLKKLAVKDMPPLESGMLITNPPYGERLGDMNQLTKVYRQLGDGIKKCSKGVTGHVITSSRFLSQKTGLSPKKADPLWNGVRIPPAALRNLLRQY